MMSTQISRGAVSARALQVVPATRAVAHRALFAGRGQALTLRKAQRSVNTTVARASPPTDTDKTAAEVDVDAIVKDLQEKWDGVENKTSVAVYAGGAVVLLWLSSTIVSAVNAVPVLPKLLELVGLGYSAWFVYRYLLFKSSREELLEDIEELKKKVTGATEKIE